MIQKKINKKTKINIYDVLYVVVDIFMLDISYIEKKKW